MKLEDEFNRVLSWILTKEIDHFVGAQFIGAPPIMAFNNIHGILVGAD
jgi:hypothetical protein